MTLMLMRESGRWRGVRGSGGCYIYARPAVLPEETVRCEALRGQGITSEAHPGDPADRPCHGCDAAARSTSSGVCGHQSIVTPTPFPAYPSASPSAEASSCRNLVVFPSAGVLRFVAPRPSSGAPPPDHDEIIGRPHWSPFSPRPRKGRRRSKNGDIIPPVFVGRHISPRKCTGSAMVSSPKMSWRAARP